MELESNLNQAYSLACELAMDRLAGMDLEKVCITTNSCLSEDEKRIFVKYLNTGYSVDPARRIIEYRDPREDLPQITVTEKVLILHYLITADICRPLSGNIVSFKELPEAAIYYTTFDKRAIRPIVKTFSANIAGFYKAGEALGCENEKYGDASVTVKVFPLVPVTYVLWQGDEEVPSNGTILFDDSISNYLPAEDIVVAASFGSYALMRLSKNRSDEKQ